VSPPALERRVRRSFSPSLLVPDKKPSLFLHYGPWLPFPAHKPPRASARFFFRRFLYPPLPGLSFSSFSRFPLFFPFFYCQCATPFFLHLPPPLLSATISYGIPCSVTLPFPSWRSPISLWVPPSRSFSWSWPPPPAGTPPGITPFLKEIFFPPM